MTPADLDYVWHKIDAEGFEHTFVDHFEFTRVQDETFHALRRAYIEAHKALEKYLSRKPQVTNTVE